MWICARKDGPAPQEASLAAFPAEEVNFDVWGRGLRPGSCTLPLAVHMSLHCLWLAVKVQPRMLAAEQHGHPCTFWNIPLACAATWAHFGGCGPACFLPSFTAYPACIHMYIYINGIWITNRYFGLPQNGEYPKMASLNGENDDKSWDLAVRWICFIEQTERGTHFFCMVFWFQLSRIVSGPIWNNIKWGLIIPSRLINHHCPKKKCNLKTGGPLRLINRWAYPRLINHQCWNPFFYPTFFISNSIYFQLFFTFFLIIIVILQV